MKRLIMVPLALMLAMVAFEGWLRATTGYRPLPSFIPKPGVGFVFDPASAPGLVNSMGFIDKERNPSAPTGERVLLLGDSFVSGTTLALRLEEQLAKALGRPKWNKAFEG